METRTVLAECLENEIVIRYDVAKAEFSLTGCDKNPIVALGMLDYASARVRRFLTTNDIQHEIQDASRIVGASRVSA